MNYQHMRQPIKKRLQQLMISFWWRVSGLNNCYLVAKRLQQKVGGYFVERKTRHKHWWPFFKKHYLWLPPECPEKGKPCPYLISYVPRWKHEPKLPPPLFNGEIKRGDE